MVKIKYILKRVWHFLWHENSIWSWLANLLIAFLLVKYLVYPGLGLILGTSYPVVAVISQSMEHQNNFDSWWLKQRGYYQNFNISKEEFEKFPFKNGFQKGDVMVLKGTRPEEIALGEIVVFKSYREQPVIHRVIRKWFDDGYYFFQTKGDNNPESIKSFYLDETKIASQQIIGKAVFRIPYLGWIKIIFSKIITILAG